jgi:hypothetical protein
MGAPSIGSPITSAICDLHPREDRRPGAQEELGRLAVQHDATERPLGQPPPLRTSLVAAWKRSPRIEASM